MYICHILRSMLTARHIVALLLTGLFMSLFDYEFALGQGQSQPQTFLPYNNPNLGVSIQYPSDWQIQEESIDKLRFIKQEGFVTADLNVEDMDRSQSTLSEYANTRINELRTQRPEFQLISNEPITISNKPAQKVVYTFEREEDGKTNKVMRIWSANEDKLYTLAYIAESGQYDRYLPMFQRMVDSFRIGGSYSGSSTTQVQSSDRSSEDNNGSGNCDRISYPDPNICIPPSPPDLNCPDITYTNFRVTGPDPHGFDRDKDGIGCESTDGGGVTPPDGGDGNCDPSYPDICIKSPPPDLNCPEIPNKNFKVIGNDPHGFDRDNDGIGCESVDGGNTPTPELGIGDGCIEIDGYLLSEGSYLDDRKRIVGSPCNPEEFCSDVGSTDPTVRDHCMDIWLDFDCDDPGMEGDPRCIDGDRNPCYPDPTSPECITPAPEPEPLGYCNPGLRIIDGICGPYDPGGVYCKALGCPGSPPDPYGPVARTPTSSPMPTPVPTPTPEPTQTPAPTPPVDPNLQPQCEFGVNPETGLCNTEDISSEPLTPTPEPTATPDEEFSTEEEPIDSNGETDGNGDSGDGSSGDGDGGGNGDSGGDNNDQLFGN
jgi:hypothetical protein